MRKILAVLLLMMSVGSASAQQKTIDINSLPIPTTGSGYLTNSGTVNGDWIPVNRNGITYKVLAGQGGSCGANQFVNLLSPQGVPSCATPTFSASSITGVVGISNGGTGSNTGNLSALNVLGGASATTTITLAQKYGYLEDVMAYGATGNGTTDDCGGTNAIQTAFNSNPNGVVYFPPGTYKCTGPIKLVDASGHNFQGKIVGSGINSTTINFINAGNSTDADSAMQHGFQAYPVTNGSGGDTTGFKNGSFQDMTINGPTHGAGIYLANSLGIAFNNIQSNANRYGFATETNISDQFINVGCAQFKNACIGWIYSGDTSRVWYGSVSTPLNSYWNDSPTVIGGVAATDVVGAAACILDMGSESESVRQILGMSCDSTAGGVGVQYGYLGRNANPTISGGTWYENINYPVAVLTTNSGAGGSSTHIPGISGSEPNGFMTYGSFPDGFSYTARVTNIFTANGINDIDLSGVTGGPSTIGQNISSNVSAYHLVSTQSGDQLIFDQGDTLINPTGVYKNLSFNRYFSIPLLNSAITIGSSNSVAFNGNISAVAGTFTGQNLTINGNQIDEYATNANGEVALNYTGYAGGTTQFRDTEIFNGKNATVAKFIGATNAAYFSGSVGVGTSTPPQPLTVVGNGTFSSAVTIGTNAFVSGASLTTGGAYAAPYAPIIVGSNNGVAFTYNTAIQMAFAGSNDVLELGPFGTSAGDATPTLFLSGSSFDGNGSVGIGSSGPRAALDMSQKTGAILLPIGTTGTRPSAVNGMIRYNSGLTPPAVEAYQNNAWGSLISSSSPTITTPTFITNATVPLVIGGGSGNDTLTLESTSSGTHTTDSILFKTGAQATAMLVNSGGAIAIGTTSVSGSAGSISLQVAGKTLITGGTSCDGDSSLGGVCIIHNSTTLGFEAGLIDAIHANVTGFPLCINCQGTGQVAIGAPTFASGASLTVGGTNAMVIPIGTTAQRPSPATNGMIRYNSTNNNLEAYANNIWSPAFTSVTSVVATGATPQTATCAAGYYLTGPGCSAATVVATQETYVSGLAGSVTCAATAGTVTATAFCAH